MGSATFPIRQARTAFSRSWVTSGTGCSRRTEKDLGGGRGGDLPLIPLPRRARAPVAFRLRRSIGPGDARPAKPSPPAGSGASAGSGSRSVPRGMAYVARSTPRLRAIAVGAIWLVWRLVRWVDMVLGSRPGSDRWLLPSVQRRPARVAQGRRAVAGPLDRAGRLPAG